MIVNKIRLGIVIAITQIFIKRIWGKILKNRIAVFDGRYIKYLLE